MKKCPEDSCANELDACFLYRVPDNLQNQDMIAIRETQSIVM